MSKSIVGGSGLNKIFCVFCNSVQAAADVKGNAEKIPASEGKGRCWQTYCILRIFKRQKLFGLHPIYYLLIE